MCYLNAAHVQQKLDGSEVYIYQHSTYRDRLLRTDSGWRIQYRHLTNEHTEGLFLPPGDIERFSSPVPSGTLHANA